MTSDRYEELLKSAANEKRKQITSEDTKTTVSDSDKIAAMRSSNKIYGRTAVYCRRRIKFPDVDKMSITETLKKIDEKSSQSHKTESSQLDDDN